ENTMSSSTLLWYNSPAKAWTQSLPIGNGTLGAMIYGGASKELYSLRNTSCYSIYIYLMTYDSCGCHQNIFLVQS
ncbi:MAG: glycoside hydrolase N-terminal domain-containing protein, partial [Firmicutes bacterium]|nr:glycoside hydrolase N-terminal domain-containing protein [Bacillota bacterium]